MRMSVRSPRAPGAESGFALVGVLLFLLVGTIFAMTAWATTNADIPQSARDRQGKEAYAAAEAGINYYLFRLGQNNAYWTNCDQVAAPNSTEANPVNLAGATTLRWRNVQGSGAQYAIELLPQNGNAQCLPGSSATATMLDAASSTMQIRSTGRSGLIRRSVVTTLRRAGFLDFLYFTDFETEDPQVTSSSQVCNVYRRAGRSSNCPSIVFANADAVNGPLHTNDDILTCGSPTFGRTATDSVEVSAPAPGYASGCGGAASPNFKGTWRTDAKLLTLPSTNTTLEAVAQAGYLFTGTTTITINGGSMTVVNGGSSQFKSLPANGVIYVKNGASCTAAYSGTQKYDEPAGCGNVYVQGTYSSNVTIASERDIIVTNDFKRSGNAIGGLVANGFVRVYHPVSTTCGDVASGPFGPAINSLQIDAAILTLQHSFIVDNYKCGSPRGTLTVNGAIGQEYRGPVGTGGTTVSTGYAKSYNYDDRLRVVNPPYFLDPVQSSWRRIRYTEQVPPRQGG
jgi:Tfp pilus assembly protein PilX